MVDARKFRRVLYPERKDPPFMKHIREALGSDDATLFYDLYREAFQLTNIETYFRNTQKQRWFCDIILRIVLENSVMRARIQEVKQYFPKEEEFTSIVTRVRGGEWGSTRFAGILEGNIRFEVDDASKLSVGRKVFMPRLRSWMQILEVEGNMVWGTFCDLQIGDELHGISIVEQSEVRG